MKANPSLQDDIEASVRATLARHGRLGDRAAALPLDASLAEAGLTSLACVDVMLALEAEFGEFPERLLSARVFRSIGTIVAAMREVQAA